MQKNIILIGGGGHCKSCIDVIISSGEYNIYGIVDKGIDRGVCISSVYVIGSDNDLAQIHTQIKSACITVGQIESPKIRKNIYSKLQKIGFELPSILSKSNHMSAFVQYNEGNIFMNMSCINAGTIIGKCNIINSKALIEHDCVIGDFNHISTGVILNGGVKIGNDCFIGSGSLVKNHVSICDRVVIGIGSVVVKDIDKPGLYYGNPVKFIRDIHE